MYTKKLLFSLLFLALTTIGWGQTTYNLITSTSDLVTGKKYLIVSGTANGTAYAMGYQASNNRPQVSITIASGSITTTPATSNAEITKAFEVTLGGSSGAWTLYDAANSGYLYAASSSSNYLKTQTTLTTWTISFSSGVATLTSQTGVSRNILKYNSGSSLFSCYSSGQNNVYLYKEASSTPTINTSTSSLTGFTYVEGSGPSAEQSFTVSGSNLTADITVTPPTNWEVSLTSGSGFTTSLTLTQSGGTVGTTTIYTRMKSGLTAAASPYSGNIACASTGATTQNVAVSGTVTSRTISFSVTSASIAENGVSYTLQATSNVMGSQTADIVVTGGTATNGNEYTYATVTASFASSTTYSTVITINDNGVCGTATNVIFGFSNLSSGLILGTNTSLNLTINDDDLVSGTLYQQDFELSPATPTLTYSTPTNFTQSNLSSTWGGSYAASGAYGLANTTNNVGEIIFNSVNLSSASNLQLSLRVAAIAGTSGNGMDASDYLTVSISTDGGNTFSDEVTINGSNNSYWSYATGTATASVTYDGNNIASTFAPSGSGNRTTDGYSTILIDALPSSSNLVVKISCDDNDNNETWAIDDVKIIGDYCNICSQPTADAVFYLTSPTNVATTSLTLSWTNGDGDNRIVVMSENPITFVPSDASTYTANASYGSGTDLGSGQYVVYNGSSNTVDVTNLTPGTLYYTKIFEYSCFPGNEDYYTSGLPATDTFLTEPETPATFSVVCVQSTSVDLEWTAPTTGSITGYVLVVREGASPHSLLSTDPSSIIGANLDYTLASTYGSTTPYSRFLYIGTGTSVTVTGLTTGTSYTFELFAYSLSGGIFEYSTGTTTTQTIELENVTLAYATGGDTQATVVWSNPLSSCYDDILVVANETSGIDFTPSGDGSAYTPNTVYGGINSVVYNTSGSTVTVTGLTNGTTYYFEIFVRNGTEWSSGVEVSVVPNAGTVYKAGELVFVGYDAQYSGSGANDEYLVASLVDMSPGTTFSLVNSRYEAGAAANVRTDKWGGAGDDASYPPGVALITYTGSLNIPAGSVLIFHTDGTNNVFDYVGVITGTITTDETANFTTSLPFGTGSAPNISTSGSDQIFLIQGGFTYDGTTDVQQANYILNGILLHGITNRAAWVPLTSACNGDASGGNTRESRLHPSLNCFNVENTNSSAESGYYQNSQIHSGSLRDIILGIGNASYWTLGTSRYTINASSTASNRAGHTFTVSGGNPSGTWVSSSDSNWFNCANWENLAVPDENADVLISNTYSSINPVIDYLASSSDLFSDLAQTKNLTIEGLKLILEGSTSNKLEVYGNLTIQSSGSLDMDDSTSADDGQLYLVGNWDNQVGESAFAEGNGTIHFDGTTAQTVTCNSGTETEKFYNVILNNPVGFTTDDFNNDLYAAGSLTMTQGDLTVKSGHYALAGKNLTVETGTTLTIENEGSLVQTDDSGVVTNNGTTIVQKTTSPYNQYDYTYFSSPIVNETVTDALSPFSPLYYLDAGNYLDLYNSTSNSTTTTGFPQLYGLPDGFDDAAPYDWQTATGFMTPGLGYIGRGNTARPSGQAVTFTAAGADGRLNNGVINVTVEKDGYTVTGGSTAAELISNNNANLIGNPYPSALSLVELYSDNSSVLTGTFYFWTHSTAPSTGITGPWLYNYDANDFATYNATGTPIGTASANGGATPSGYAASGQGFIALMDESYGTNTGTLQFNNSQRGVPTVSAYNNNQFFRQTNNTSDRIWLNLQTPDNESRIIAIGFENGASNAYDAYDSPRMENGHANDFYSLITPADAFKLAIQRLEPFTEDKTIPLGMELTSAGTCQIALNNTEGIFSESQNVYLEDKSLNVIHNLSLGAYSFTQTAGDNINNRFVIRFTNTQLGIDDASLSNLQVYPNPSKNVFYLNYQGSETLKVEIFDLLGKRILQAVNPGSIDLSNYNSGIYLAKFTTPSGSITKKLVRE